MGVYIRGMEMPEDGETVTLTICADGLAFEEFKEPGDVFHAVPVPPHGRLIDADVLVASFKESIEECHKWANEIEGGEMYARVSQSLGTFVECSLRTKAAPTIISAEEGEQ